MLWLVLVVKIVIILFIVTKKEQVYNHKNLICISFQKLAVVWNNAIWYDKKILLQFKEMHLSKKEKNSMRIKFKNDHKKKTENFINKLHDYLPEKNWGW